MLREKGYNPNAPEFSNLGTNELVRRANDIKKATKYYIRESVKDEDTEESALENAFRNNVVERLKRLETNQNTMMTAINNLADRVKSLEERPSKTEDRQENRVKMVDSG